MAKIFDLTSIRFIKRITIGQQDNTPYSEEDAKKDLDFINKCLNDFPKGHIIACEKNFKIMNMGEHQVVQQYVVYHIAFEKKPLWIQD
ncbi:hypothetical protein CQA53_09575 [Helicobacter didelphidarum]|uniref:Uncharacterized protein n=1 Tax=Helicobacter didelphidarum TaxID=2040648 RepID=A0A3D8IAC9_9HELI|nr:hypothetical protein [Helicobacter didelphidarum]RDU62058.1 hypothetical protein CQA53_09575 [Helicobacter didelphidarum]